MVLCRSAWKTCSCYERVVSTIAFVKATVDIKGKWKFLGDIGFDYAATNLPRVLFSSCSWKHSLSEIKYEKQSSLEFLMGHIL